MKCEVCKVGMHHKVPQPAKSQLAHEVQRSLMHYRMSLRRVDCGSNLHGLSKSTVTVLLHTLLPSKLLHRACNTHRMEGSDMIEIDWSGSPIATLRGWKSLPVTLSDLAIKEPPYQAMSIAMHHSRRSTDTKSCSVTKGFPVYPSVDHVLSSRTSPQSSYWTAAWKAADNVPAKIINGAQLHSFGPVIDSNPASFKVALQLDINACEH